MTALNMMNNKVPNVIFSIGRNVTLKENSFSAKNPTYAELKEFLKSRSYLSDYYASETLHNDAEAAGIKCAFVWWQGDTAEAHIESSRGLANTFFSFSNIMYLNAFQTTDKGLVFIYPKSLGCVLYLEKGKPVGLIDISNAVYTNYDYFEKYSTMVDSERKRISKVMTGYYPVIPGFPSYNKLTAVTGKCDIYW